MPISAIGISIRIREHTVGRESGARVARSEVRCGPYGQAGFTLLELALTVGLLVLVLSLVMPRMELTSSLSGTGRQLAGAIQSLFTAATASNRTYRLNLDLDSQRYWATVLTGDGEHLPADPALAFQTTLSSAVKFEDVVIGSRGKVTTGKVFIEFFPGGMADRAFIHLSNHAGHVLAMVLNPVTGSLEVFDRYTEPVKAPIPDAYREFFKALPIPPPLSPGQTLQP